MERTRAENHKIATNFNNSTIGSSRNVELETVNKVNPFQSLNLADKIENLERELQIK